MLRITQNSAVRGAKSYYTTADYYSEGQELVGVWRGKGADRLGLAGVVEQREWDSLCDNRHPQTGEKLTPRTKQDRRVGYDFNFHAPKSVSLLFGLTGDERIRDAFLIAVNSTMGDMEAEMQTRVRAGGRDADRITGNLTWGEFLHMTARPVNGIPDPHLHIHAFCFNVSWDPIEDRWKAGQFAGLKRDAPYFEAMFHSRLARELEDRGFNTVKTARGWEIEGVPISALGKFSRRTALIEAKAREKGIIDASEKGALGASTRESKNAELGLPELRAEWAKRLTEDEELAIWKLATRASEPSIVADGRSVAAEAVRWALDHVFERRAVADERSILSYALNRSVGRATPAEVSEALDASDVLRVRQNDRTIVTTLRVLDEESRMLDFARDGRGTCAPLKAEPHDFQRIWLNEGQRGAVEHVLKSRDRVTIVRGAAGVGKTSMMQEAVTAMEASGHRVLPLAPSANASRDVLRSEGFARADTVARFLVDPELQSHARGGVIWIDEAGLLGTPTLSRVFQKARELDARIVLSGDRRQHASVERGSPLRLLETQAGLLPAGIKEIQRQSGTYKQAVKFLSEGRVSRGLATLDSLGWIREIPEKERYQEIAQDYLRTAEEGKSGLVIAPTHREGERVTEAIREALKGSGKLGKKERQYVSLQPRHLTEAERRDASAYMRGDVLIFHQNAKSIRRGTRFVVGKDALPIEHADKFQVFRPAPFAIAPGERLRITRNGETASGGHRLNNGAIYTVKRIEKNGAVVLNNGWRIASDYGHVTHGYAQTSHASQSKTVDRVLIAQSAASYGASSREQAYVSISRGRERAIIYTDDKQALLEAVSRSEERMAAVELVQEMEKRSRARAPARLSERPAIASETPIADKRKERVAYDR